MNKAIINALTLAAAEAFDKPLSVARSFAEAFVEDNGELFSAPAAPAYHPPDGHNAGRGGNGGFVPQRGNVAGAIPMAGVSKGGLPVSAITQEELKRQQVAGYIAAGVTLCANCQQPTTDHLPGCARASQEDPKAVTKNPLPPVS